MKGHKKSNRHKGALIELTEGDKGQEIDVCLDAPTVINRELNNYVHSHVVRILILLSRQSPATHWSYPAKAEHIGLN